MNLQVGVKVFIVNSNKKYLFLRRSHTLHSEKEAYWDIPGGRINSNESLLPALKREVSEETGLVVTTVPKLLAAQDIFVAAKDLHVVRLTYSAAAEGEVILSDEHNEYSWWTKEEAMTKHLDPYLKEVL